MVQQWARSPRRRGPTRGSAPSPELMVGSSSGLVVGSSSGLPVGSNSRLVVGSVVLLGTLLAVQACTNRDVVGVVVTEVSVAPPDASLVEGDTLRFRDVVTDDGGSSLNAAPVEWSVADSTIVSIDADGLTTALSRGTTTVHAEFRGVSGEATVTVIPEPRIAADPSALIFFGGLQEAPVPSQEVSITNANGDGLEGLDLEVRYAEGQPTGWLDASLADQTAPTMLTVTAVLAGLPAGQYSADVVVSSRTSTTSQVARSSVTIPVTLSLSQFSVVETDGSTVVTEAGGTDSLTVILQSEPAGIVVMNVFSQDPGEVSVTPDRLSFDASNWDVPRVITVTGVDDSVIDGAVQTDVVVEVDTLATGGAFAAVPPQTVSVTTEDDDTGAIVVSRDTAAVDETGLVDSVMVTLSVMPDSAVVLAVESDDTAEVSVSPKTLTIQPSEWNVGKAITFTGVDDPITDGPQVATVTVSVVTDASDGDLDAAPDVTIEVTNADADIAGFTVTETGGTTTVSESGTTDDFQVVLTTQPRPGSVVVLDVVSPAPGEVTVSQDTIRFDESTWDVPRTVTLTGVDDGEDDGDEVTDIEISVGAATSDPDYASVPAQTLSVTTIDTKLVVQEIGETTVVSEPGGTDQFAVALSHQPASNVVVSVTSDDTSEATVDKAQLTFTPDNWSTAQPVMVQAVDDAVDDGDALTDVRLTVVNGSSDPIFHDVADTVHVTTTDDDVAGIALNEGGTVVSESGSTDEFGVSLTAQPAAGTSVVLNVSSADPGEVTVDPAPLTFTPDNWSTAQTVTVTGVPDNTVDGDQTTDVTISVDLAGTTAPAYSSVNDEVVSVTTTDVDVAAVTVNDRSAAEGASFLFSVTLNNSVEGGLTVEVTLTDGTAVAPADYDDVVGTLSFAGTLGEVQQFTVSTVSDDIVEAPETFTVSLDASHPGVTDTDTATGTINDGSAVTMNDAVVHSPFTTSPASSRITITQARPLS